MNFLKDSMNHLENETLDELSNITKTLGDTILCLYDTISVGINDNKTENLAKQQEIELLVNENNILRQDVATLMNYLEKLENFLGVKPNERFILK
jgi:hypothetical protein